MSARRPLAKPLRRCARALLRPAMVLAAALTTLPAIAVELSAGSVLPHDSASDVLPRAAAMADANGDGRSDVIFFNIHHTTAATEEQYLAYLYEQQADGTMRRAMRFSMIAGGVTRYGQPDGVAFGDLDGDGRAELVLPDAAHDHLVIFKRGVDRYDEVKRLALPFDFAFHQISIEDLDRDGIPEILYHHVSQGFAIYRGLGGLNYLPPMAVMSYVSNGFLIDDADGDGVRDLLVAINSVELNAKGFAINFGLAPRPGDFGRRRRGFFGLPAFSGMQQAYSIGVGQFAGDSKPEIVLLSRTEYPPDEHNTVRMPQTISVYRMDDPHHYTLLKRYEYRDVGAVMPAHLRVTDLDGDGRDEVYVFRSGQLEVIQQQGDGFAPVYLPQMPAGFAGSDPFLASTHFADFNGDGCRDVGYLANGYVIHYRQNCPSGVAMRKPAQPAMRVTPRIKPRRGVRLRR
ncbi:MAG: VCBS repeat-containing protein [Lysobacteraceae bacterium]|nr:MAG: VCBS repeat-containing protein [Xanthomonadaceae bacterium]